MGRRARLAEAVVAVGEAGLEAGAIARKAVPEEGKGRGARPVGSGREGAGRAVVGRGAAGGAGGGLGGREKGRRGLAVAGGGAKGDKAEGTRAKRCVGLVQNFQWYFSQASVTYVVCLRWSRA